ncbi:hypothetical protein BH10PLA2_BH10PLA2_31120 [soil metagenome]
MRETLCATCQFKREIRTARSCFLLCQLSSSDARFPKYPAQPVRACRGYQPARGNDDRQAEPTPGDSL